MHEIFMEKALKLATSAFEIGDVPIGCVIADKENNIVGSGYNMRNYKKSSLCHAELTAIEEACKTVGDWRLEDCTLYVTVEPCPMCAGAIVQSRIKTVVFGTRNPKAGCAGSILNILQDDRFNHWVEIVEGVMREECSEIMSEFFKRFRTVR